jgi:hypothetical protein
MNFSVSALAAGFVLGAFGIYFIKCGKQEGNIAQILIGAGLVAFPYFVESATWTWGLGAVLMSIGFWVRNG